MVITLKDKGSNLSETVDELAKMPELKDEYCNFKHLSQQLSDQGLTERLIDHKAETQAAVKTFTKEKMTRFLKKIFTTRCQSSMTPMYRAYNLLMLLRTTSFLVLTGCHQFSKARGEANSQHSSIQELKSFGQDIKMMQVE